MAEIKKISYDEIKEIAAEHNFGIDLMLKDYYVTLVLYLLKDLRGIYFKGGTALQKIFLNYSRLSEDADFTVTGDISKVKKAIEQLLEESKLFNKISYDKDVEGFTRIVAHYTNFSNRADVVFVDINQRAKLIQTPEMHEISHFYEGHIPKFSMNTLARDEMFAEKVAAMVGRNRPRDHYDVYTIIKAGLPINLELVKQKCKQSGVEFNIPRMFSRADKLKFRWDRDMIPLLAEEVPFVEVMRALANYFKLKETKKAEREQRKK
ncbi:nucleotidyl transferase AbiEii/AbiGii toxin family protein [Candidatus Woesearchaeota archaeon]|nr:nucleotidyl transferase AbiEii/AbiGii toxin family protein [Candidatus Woesearchaeota archaeon]